jgi:hypothetical protein
VARLDIFDDRTSSISRLYREVDAEHHLVQAKLNERPDIPGLTPRGFERWATLMIQAHPDREFARLQKAVLDMPISNPDDKKERFPKEIPRKLFPKAPDLALRRQLEQAIQLHCQVKFPLVPVGERPVTPHRRRPSIDKASTKTAEPVSPGLDRGRQSYSTSSQMAIEEDGGRETTAKPIERERKPYTAQLGGGKVYDGIVESRHTNTESVATSTKPKEFHGHRASHSHGQNPTYIHPGIGSASLHLAKPTSRARSSSVGVNKSSPYRHSESDLLSYEISPHHSPSPISALPDDLIKDGYHQRSYDDDTSKGRIYDQERETERYHDPLFSHDAWTEEDFYRGVPGGQESGGNGGSESEYKPSWSRYR